MALGWRVSRDRGFLIPAWLWLAYAAYEFLMYTRVLCSGDCNIRIDLLIIYPTLVGSTLLVLVTMAIRAILRKRKGAKAT